MAWWQRARSHYLNQCWSTSMRPWGIIMPRRVNTLRPRQNGRHFADDIFKCIVLNENVSISIKFSLKFVPKGPINNIPALVQIMAWRRPGDKPLSEPMMVNLLTHICVTRPQWVKAECKLSIMFELLSRNNNCNRSYITKALTLSNHISLVHGLRINGKSVSCLWFFCHVPHITQKSIFVGTNCRKYILFQWLGARLQ